MLFGNGLSALMTLMASRRCSCCCSSSVRCCVGGERPGRGWARWLAYFGALGAGFMLLEVALLQRFVLLLGHPVYSLTVTLFSLLLGTGTRQPHQPPDRAGARAGRHRHAPSSASRWSRSPRRSGCRG